MSITTVRTIMCDGCANWISGDGETVDKPASIARARLKRMGWHLTRDMYGPRDICPACWSEGER